MVCVSCWNNWRITITPSLRPESLTNERFRFDSIILFGNNDDDTVELKQSSLSLSLSLHHFFYILMLTSRFQDQYASRQSSHRQIWYHRWIFLPFLLLYNIKKEVVVVVVVSMYLSGHTQKLSWSNNIMHSIILTIVVGEVTTVHDISSGDDDDEWWRWAMS